MTKQTCALRVKSVGFEVLAAMTMKNASSGIWRRVGFVRTGVSEERFNLIFRVYSASNRNEYWKHKKIY
jgi:hypothetical protein